MKEAPMTNGWLAAVDRVIRVFERPYAKGGFCQSTPSAGRLALIMGLAAATQLFIPLMERLGPGLGLPLALGYGGLTGFLLWTALAWTEQVAPHWPSVRSAGAKARQLPGFAGLSMAVLFTFLLAVAPLLILLPKGRSMGAFWGALFLVYATLMMAYQKASQGAMRRLELARDQSLRARLAPHFLFNTLNSLKAQIEKDPATAAQTVDRLASLFRQLVEAADRATVPLREELAFVEAYLGIERSRMGDRLQVEVQVPEELEEVEVPPFSLQVLVENAVRHGAAPLEAGGRVTIRARRDGAWLVVTVEDPGQGPGLGQPGTGTALETLRQRLARPEDLVMGLVDGHHQVTFRWKA